MKIQATQPAILGLLISVATILHAETQPVICQSAERQTALLELYTSEGCSSCPPAETWLSQQKESAALWKDFVPLAFHVDYWNNLGWRDPWSSKQYTQRQNAYAELWKADSIYTPEFVLNGREWRSGLTKRTIPTPPNGKVGVLMAQLTGTNHWQATFMPAQSDASAYEVNAALLVSGLSSDVKAGENQGRKLVHNFAVLKLAKETLELHDGAWRGEFTLSPPPNAPAGRLALAVWVCPSGQMQPLQATGCWLPRPHDSDDKSRRLQK